MKMNADSAYLIGASHTEIGCQDYALSRVNDKRAIIVVSDGCSSAPYTDVGSRIISHSAMNILDTVGEELLASKSNEACYSAFKVAITQDLKRFANLLGPTAGSMLQATLLAAYTDGKKYIILAYGDGIIAFQRLNELDITRIEYSHNTPQYLGYRISDDLDKQYHALSVGETKTLTFDVLVSGQSERHGVDTLSYDSPVVFVGDVGDLVSLTLSSDGAGSVRHKLGQPVSQLNEVRDLLNFPNHKGIYVKRRLNAFSRTLNKTDKLHDDDLGVASIHFSR